MAQRIVRTLIRIGAFDSLTSGSRAAIDYDAHAHLSQSIAERGIVLLKNNGLLPLDPAGLRSIAVIGGNADRAVPTGGGAAAVEAIGGDPVSPPRQDDTFRTSVWIPSSPLLALRELAPTVDFHFHDGADPRAAAGVAGECSAAIVFATQLSSEFYDHPTLELPGGQADLIRHVAAVNARTCVVLETSGAVLTNWASEVAAVLEAWYPGQRGGEAIANVIFGEVNPSGRLPLTFPRAIEDLPRPQLDRPPASLDFVRSEDYDAADREEEFRVEYREGSNIGYKWYDSKDRVPAYCFGHGLSYTSFSYSNLEVDASGPEVRVRFTVSNDGPLAGDDIPQVYASTPMPRRRERRRLVSWTRIQLEPGERHTIDLSVDNKYLSRWDTDGGVWVRDSGTYEFSVGASSRDLRLHGGVTLLASL
jgi:beta-glucosidase